MFCESYLHSVAHITTIYLFKLIQVCLSQWLFGRESEIFQENETLYLGDTVIQEKTSNADLFIVS